MEKGAEEYRKRNYQVLLELLNHILQSILVKKWMQYLCPYARANLTYFFDRMGQGMG